MTATARDLHIERVDLESIQTRVERLARRDAALSPAVDRHRLDDYANAAIDTASGMILDREHPPLPAWQYAKLYWSYVAAFAEARSQMVRWPK